MQVGDSVGIPAPVRKWGKSEELVKNDLFVGLELELEDCGNHLKEWTAPILESGLWRITEDGSLRNNGREYIMQEAATGQPLMGDDIVRALKAFGSLVEKLREHDRLPAVTKRTSTHVHLDVRAMTHEQISRFFLLWYTFEDILFAFVGQDRDKSNYCRAASRNPDILNRAAEFLSDIKRGRIDPRKGNKYDAMNFQSIGRIGTIEVRLMHGLYEVNDILNWINILLRLYDAALDPTINIDEFPEQVSTAGIPEFLHMVFKDQAALLAPHASPLDILRGVRVAQEILVMSQIGVQHTSEYDEYRDSGPDGSARLEEFKRKVKV